MAFGRVTEGNRSRAVEWNKAEITNSRFKLKKGMALEIEVIMWDLVTRGDMREGGSDVWEYRMERGIIDFTVWDDTRQEEEKHCWYCACVWYYNAVRN